MSNNVQFLRGPQANLDKLTTFTEGSFYLTEDSERLYYAKSSNEIVYLNKYVVSVESISKLPAISNVNAGDLYYSSSENILCVKAKASDTSWTQINKNTDTDYRVTAASLTKDDANSDNNNLVYNLIITQKAYDVLSGDEITGKTIEDVTTTLTIPVSEMISSGVNVGQNGKLEKQSDNTNNIVLYNSGNGANEDSIITLIPEGGIEFSSSDDGFIVKSETYTLDNSLSQDKNITSINLKDSNGDIVNSAKFEAGLDIEFAQQTGSENIQINHSSYTYDSTNEITSTNQEVSHNDSFDIITGLTVINGHITGVKKGSVKLPKDQDTVVNNISANNNGIITVGLKDIDGNDLPSITSNQDLYYKINDSIVYNQGDLADYLVTKTSLRALNAMVYKGTIEENTTIDSLYDDNNKASVGDTWLVNASVIQYEEGLFAYHGDLLIVNGEENSEGYVETINWDYVPSANEDTTYHLEVANNTINLISEVDGSSKGSVELTTNDTNNPIEIITTTVNAEKNQFQIQIKHDQRENLIANNEDISTKKDEVLLKYNETIETITGLTKDSYGHIIGYEITPYKLPESVNTTYGLELSTDKVILKDSDGDPQGSIKVASGETIEVSVSASTDNKNSIFTVNHANVQNSKEAATASAKVVSGGSLAYIKDITVNAQGHVTEVITDTASFFEDTTYTLSGEASVSNNKITFGTTLKNDSGDDCGTASLVLDSTSLEIIQDADTKTVSMNLVWGSF